MLVKDQMRQALPTPFGKGRESGGGGGGDGESREVVGDGTRDLEAPFGPGIGAFLLPQYPRTWSATGGTETWETKMRAQTGLETDCPSWAPGATEAGTFLDLTSPQDVTLLARRLWEIYLTCPTRVPQTAARAQCLKPQAKSIWSSGF